MSARRAAHGMTLLEVVVFIVVAGIGLVAMMALFNRLGLASVDPVVRKQALSIAASLLEEIQLRGFTYCDPDDPNVHTAAAPAECTSPAHVEGLGPDTTPPHASAETRYAEPRFDNVNDYKDFAMAGSAMRSVDGTVIAGLEAYAVSVAVEPLAVNELPDVPSTEGLRITVTATGPAGVAVRLQGYRLRYAPNSP